MITKFKIFENVSYPYKVGDYLLIIVRSRNVLYNDVLCQIIEIRNDGQIEVEILDNRIENILRKEKFNVVVNKNSIICWSENRDELEAIIKSNKYNL